VGVVHVGHGTELFCQLDDLVHLGDVAVHGEDAVGDYEDAPGWFWPGVGLFEDLLQSRHVGVGEYGPLGLGQPDAVDYGAVVQLVADDHVTLPDQLGDEPGVGGEARLVRQGGLHVLEPGQGLLHLEVQVHGAGDGPYGP
jgi:hypothetical protein